MSKSVIDWANDPEPRLKSRVSGRKPAGKWLLAVYRAVGEFKDGERRMMRIDHFRPKTFKSERAAKKAQAANWRPPLKTFIYQGRRPKRVTEIQINYSAE